MFCPYEDRRVPRWQVFTNRDWRIGCLYGEYGLLSEADRAMDELRSDGFIPLLRSRWNAHYTDPSNR